MPPVVVDNEVCALAFSICDKVTVKDEDAPLAGCVGISASDGRLRLRAGANKSFVEVSLPCTGALDGERAVNLQILRTLASAAGKRAGMKAPLLEMELREGGGKLGVSLTGRSFELETALAEDMEKAPAVEGWTEECHYEKPGELGAALDFALPAEGKDSSRYLLCGVLLVRDWVACSDGWRLHATSGMPVFCERGLTLPSPAAWALSLALRKLSPPAVEAAFDEKTRLVRFALTGRSGLRVVVSATAPEGDCPDVTRVLPKDEGGVVVELPTQEAHNALTMAKKVARLNGQCVLVADADKGKLYVHAVNETAASYTEALDAKVEGGEGPVRLLIDCGYGLQAIARMGPLVRLRMASATLPILVRGAHPNRVVAVMPCREDGAGEVEGGAAREGRAHLAALEGEGISAGATAGGEEAGPAKRKRRAKRGEAPSEAAEA